MAKLINVKQFKPSTINGQVIKTSGGTSVWADELYISGMTFDNGTYDLTIHRTDGTDFTESLSILATDMVVTGGTYDISTGIVTFTNNSGGTFEVSGFTSGMTDSYTSTAYTSGNLIVFDNNIQGSNLYNVDISPILTANTPYQYNTTTTTAIEPRLGSNTATGDFATIGGGQSNTTYAGDSVLGGGNTNLISGTTHVLVGGSSNNIYGNGQNSFIGGGDTNTLGAIDNAAHPSYAVIVGGRENEIRQLSKAVTSYAFIGGGRLNAIEIDSRFGFLGGGASNFINGDACVIGGGQSNTTNDNHNTIGGGQSNTTNGNNAFVGGGLSNWASGNWSAVAGGNSNSGSSANGFFIGAGQDNRIISSRHSSIVGGQNNTIGTGGAAEFDNSILSVIGGGLSNIITSASTHSMIGAGSGNTIEDGLYSFIAAGSGNTIGHNNSFILGSAITSVSADTTHVNRFNIGTVDTSTAVNVLVRESDGMINTRTISSITGGTVQQLNDLTDVTTTPLLPYSSTTEADDGKLLFFEKETEQWITDDSVTHGTSVINGKTFSSTTINVGTPVYLVDYDNDLHQVEPADATSSATMPCIGLAAQTMDNTNSKHIMTFGKLQNVDLTTGSTLNPNNETWDINDALYVNTTAGTFTKVRPTGAATRVQRIAKVLRTGATGQLLVFNTARDAGLPNLTQGYGWRGNSNNQPEEVLMPSKYAADVAFTGGTAETVTHNLGSTDVLVQVKNPSGALIIPDTVDNYLTNSVDITVSVTGTYRVIIIG